MILLRSLPLIYALLFILTRRIEVKVHKAKGLTVKINFNIFALVLKEEKIKKKSFKNIFRLIKNARHTYKSIDYLISKSGVELHRYVYLPNENTQLIKTAYEYASIQFWISYLSANAKDFHLSDLKCASKDEYNDALFDMEIRFSFLYLIISALLLLYYIVKKNLKRMLKHV